MSQKSVGIENVVVRRWFWAFENDVDAFRDLLHPDIAWFQIEEDRSPVHGINDAVQARSRWLDTWDEHRFDLEQVFEADDSVIVSVHITARGKASGAPVEVRFHARFKLLDGKVVYIFDHEDRASALEAVGLSESAMSQENVEIIRRGYEHWLATGEFRAHPDLVWDVSNLGWPDQQIYPGVDGARQFLAEWADAWDDWEMEVEDYIDAGERVLVILNQRGRSKATEISVDMRFAQVWTLRDGQGIRMQMYASPDEALEAVGLAE